jgi:uncharacterized membrane protein YdjX (TVP38/TMEM64 family)
MKRLFRFKYPKLALLAIATVAAYWLFSMPEVVAAINGLNGWEYLEIFVAGLFFSFGFTTPFAIGFFLTVEPSSVLGAALVGGLGAFLSDVVIFHTIKFSFMDEFHRLKRTAAMRKLRELIRRDFNAHVSNYLFYVFAGLIIASPLPDELGVSMLAGLTHIRPMTFAAISLLCNAAGILVMLVL